MNLKKFLDLSEGKWFSQRTNYLLGGDKADNGKADITIEIIANDDPRATKLCQKHRLDANLIVGGMVQSWDTSVDWGKDKRVGSATIILVGAPDNNRTGKLIRSEDAMVCGHYELGADEALILVIDNDDMHAEERQWFASDNLRMRTTVVQYQDGRKQTSFYSEIRKAAPKNDD